MYTSEIKHKAIILRKRGYSLREIHEKLGVTKSTCSLWLKDIHLDGKAVHRLENVVVQGRLKGNMVRADAAMQKKLGILTRAGQEVAELQHTKLLQKLSCALLYWGEGNKADKTVAFTNSDPIMIKAFLVLFRNSFSPREEKLQATIHLHEYHNVEKQKLFWHKVTGIPLTKLGIYKKANSGHNIRANYPGCITVRYHDRLIFYELEALYMEFAKQLGGLV